MVSAIGVRVMAVTAATLLAFMLAICASSALSAAFETLADCWMVSKEILKIWMSP